MKKLQMTVVMILAVFLLFSCESENEDEFLENDLTDTATGGDSDSGTDATDDNLPDGQQDTEPTEEPTTEPTTDPTTEPTTEPTTDPATDPTAEPTTDPTTDPTAEPTTDPTTDPTGEPDPEGLPECKFSNPTPCKDPSSGYIWSSKSSVKKYWNAAVEYCDTLDELGVAWRLPEIYELRTLIENCSGTQAGGSCQITKDCVAYTPCHEGCDSCVGKESFYSKVGDDETLWSATKLSDDNLKDYYVWTLNFHGASFSYADYKATSGDEKFYVRCIKK